VRIGLVAQDEPRHQARLDAAEAHLRKRRGADVAVKTGKDAAAGKATFVSLLGVERAREQAQLLAVQAAEHLEMFAEKGKLLKELAQYVVNRRA